MKRKSFLSGVIAFCAVPLLAKSKESVITPKVILPEEPLEKRLEFTHEGLIFHVCITNQILIKLPDGAFDFNTFDVYTRCIARVFDGDRGLVTTRHIKIEAPIRVREQAVANWDKDVDYIINVALKEFKSKAVSVTQVAPKLS